MPPINAMSKERVGQPRHDEDGFRLRIHGSAHAAGRARREMARLDAQLDAALLETMRLLVTELVSNSVRHAGARAVELTVAVSPEWVRVEVANAGEPFSPESRATRGEADSGWGLFLVERLSHDWGVLDDSGCQRVWFEIPRA
ncbi:MAG: ATP-binding protein [Thermoleophilaceae bacterium]